MKSSSYLKLAHQTTKTIYNGFFACGILNDYRADWALANYAEQPKISVNTIQRNHG